MGIQVRPPDPMGSLTTLGGCITRGNRVPARRGGLEFIERLETSEETSIPFKGFPFTLSV
jgi:hypothetical protein